MLKYFYIALGGSLGSVARYWVGSAVASRIGTKFPYGTFVINMSACVIIGFSLTYLGRRTGLSPEAVQSRRAKGSAAAQSAAMTQKPRGPIAP